MYFFFFVQNPSLFVLSALKVCNAKIIKILLFICNSHFLSLQHNLFVCWKTWNFIKNISLCKSRHPNGGCLQFIHSFDSNFFFNTCYFRSPWKNINVLLWLLVYIQMVHRYLGCIFLNWFGKFSKKNHHCLFTNIFF